MLSLALFRKSALIELIAQVLKSSKADKSAVILSHLMGDTGFYRTHAPLALIAKRINGIAGHR